MGFLIDLTGKRFGRWFVERRAGRDKRRNILWLCRCDCGVTKEVLALNLRAGRSTSCGCGKENCGIIKHGHAAGRSKQSSPEYNSYHAMLARCYNRRHHQFKDYGGRGIKICQRWLDDFLKFLEDMGPRPAGKTLDRYPNNNGDYSPDNCRWATRKQQAANRNRHQ